MHPRIGNRTLCTVIVIELTSGRAMSLLDWRQWQRTAGENVGQIWLASSCRQVHPLAPTHSGVSIFWCCLLHTAPRGLCRRCLQSQRRATITQTAHMELAGGSQESCSGGSLPGHLNLHPNYLPQTHVDRIRYGVGNSALNSRHVATRGTNGQRRQTSGVRKRQPK